MSKNEALKRLTLNREQYMMVIPKWCLGKRDGWDRLVDRWLGDDAEFAAKSSRARANRGKDGTHGQGNRNHWGFKAMKEAKLKRSLSDIQSWVMARARTNPKEGESKYYGNTEEHMESYKEQFERLHPPGPDASNVIESQIDETAVVSIQGKAHGRYPCFDGLITPSVSYTQLRATHPSPCSSKGHSQPPSDPQHDVSNYPLIIFLSHFFSLFSTLFTYIQPNFCRHTWPLSSVGISRCGSTCA
ncbi:hypothetical protein ZWY2020_057882 [Hordeum vulgare]|nr:hypothetical protein ZWY2020_057882 [Hordeum vulgare]